MSVRLQSFMFFNLVGVMLGAAAHAQSYPSKPIRIVVPFAAGGPSDITSRNIAPRMTEILGAPAIVVDNRGGANGIIGTEIVAKVAQRAGVKMD